MNVLHSCCIYCQVLGSMFLATLSLFTILLTFPLAFFFYDTAFGIEELPALAIMSVFLVLGISVDIIFVLCTTYVRVFKSQTATLSLLNERNVVDVRLEAAILASTLHHAFPIIAVASATTAVTFVAGMASPLVPIRQFSL